MSIQFQTENLTSNRYSGLANDTLQLVLFYDGNGQATLRFEVRASDGTLHWEVVDAIPNFATRIITRQYALGGAQLTGNFVIEGVVPNGVVDGLAFGFFWRDPKGGYHILRSNQAPTGRTADFVSAWPLGMNPSSFQTRAPQVSDGFARETALAVISGARLLPNGKHSQPVV